MAVSALATVVPEDSIDPDRQQRQQFPPPRMAEHENNRGSSSASSGVVSVKCEREVATGERSTSGRELAGDGGAVLSNGGSNSSGASISP